MPHNYLLTRGLDVSCPPLHLFLAKKNELQPLMKTESTSKAHKCPNNSTKLVGISYFRGLYKH